MNDNLNKITDRDEIDVEIPSFMQGKEYELRRQKHIRENRLREEQYKEEMARRYRLERSNQNSCRIVKKRKNKNKIKAIKIAVGGIIIIVFVAGLSALNGFAGPEALESKSVVMEIEDAFIDNSVIYDPTITEGNSNLDEDIQEITYNFDINTRLNSINADCKFLVGSLVIESEYVRNKILNNSAYEYFEKYGEMYGIDPFILMAKAVQESSLEHSSCLPGGSRYNGHGVGICQLENPDGREIVAYNYLTGEEDVMYITMDNAKDLETNIKMGAMNFQRCLEECNGNLFIAIQSYNYDPGMMNIIINRYAEDIGVSSDTVKDNYSDTNWLEIVSDVHNNPNKYLSNWRYSTYGDDNYISNVLRYFVGDKTYYNYNGSQYIFDLTNYELIEINNQNNIVK